MILTQNLPIIFFAESSLLSLNYLSQYEKNEIDFSCLVANIGQYKPIGIESSHIYRYSFTLAGIMGFLTVVKIVVLCLHDFFIQ